MQSETRNHDLYIRVRNARRQRGMPLYEARPIQHRLVGQKLYSTDGLTFTVLEAVRHWHWGWYVVLTLQGPTFRVCILYENLSCDDPVLLRAIGEDRAIYQEALS